MPYLAETNTGEIIQANNVNPEKVDKDFRCPYCGDTLGYRRESRQSDGSIRARAHFWHYERANQNSVGGCSNGGESREHEQMKQRVVQELRSRDDIPPGTVHLEEKVGDRVADVLYEFDSHRLKSEYQSPNTWGEKSQAKNYGIVIEVQYKNHNKDYVNVTKNSLKYGYSIHWVFHSNELSELLSAKDKLSQHMKEELYLGEQGENEFTLGDEIYFNNFSYIVRDKKDFSSKSSNENRRVWNWGDFRIQGPIINHPKGWIRAYTYSPEPELKEVCYSDRKGGGNLGNDFGRKLLSKSTPSIMIRLSPIDKNSKAD